MTFTDRQLELIADAVEDYAILIDEDAADECGEILDIIEAHFYNKNFKKRFREKVDGCNYVPWDFYFLKK